YHSLLEHWKQTFNRGREKAVLHQVIRTAKPNSLLIFFIWLGLLSKMQAFEHCLFGIRGCDKTFVTASYLCGQIPN
ncbi:hypothetical protein ACFCWN_08440, partial [Enterococcus faecium]